jgi:hypothetical protein
VFYTISLLFFCQLSYAQQKISFKLINGQVVPTYTKDNVESSAEELNTTHEIVLFYDPSLTPTNVEIKDGNGKLASDAVFNFNNNKERIIGNPSNPTYEMKFIFQNNQSLTISNVGKNKKVDESANATVLQNITCVPCNESHFDDEFKKELKKAYVLCPDCGDNYVLLYDARCQFFYLIKDNKVEKIDNLKKLAFNFKKGFKVKIIHVNRYLTDIKVEAIDSVYNSSAPSLFNEIFGSGGTLITGLINNLKTQSSDATKTISDDFYTKLLPLATDLNDLLEEKARIFDKCCEATALCNNRTHYDYSDFMERLFELEIEYNDIQAKLAEDIDKNKDNATTAKNLQKEKDRVTARWTTVKKLADDQLEGLINFHRNFLKDSYVFSTPMLFPQGNRYKITIKLDTRDTSGAIKRYEYLSAHQEGSVEGPVIWNWFFSFSSGPFFGFNKNLKETTYDFRRMPSFGNTINDSSKYILTAAGETDPPVGLSALAHFESKFTSGFGAGISVGVGLTVEKKPKIFYLLGPSLFLGDKNQFAITGGIAATQMDVLRKELYPDFLEYKTAPELKYRKDFRMGGFFSLTYTLFTPTKRN